MAVRGGAGRSGSDGVACCSLSTEGATWRPTAPSPREAKRVVARRVAKRNGHDRRTGLPLDSTPHLVGSLPSGWTRFDSRTCLPEHTLLAATPAAPLPRRRLLCSGLVSVRTLASSHRTPRHTGRKSQPQRAASANHVRDEVRPA